LVLASKIHNERVFRSMKTMQAGAPTGTKTRKEVPMFTVQIGGRPVGFVKFFSKDDAAAALALAHEKASSSAWILFVDTPSTPHLATLVSTLKSEGFAVVVRDHHDIDGDPATGRDREIRSAVEEVRAVLGARANISTRSRHPSCPALVGLGEFADPETPLIAEVVFADPDADGLLTAMKSMGIVYSPKDGGESAFDIDADLFDGPRAKQVGLSPLGHLLAVGLSTLPPFNPSNPAPGEKAKADLFGQFVAAVQGDATARSALEARVQQYEMAVSEAERLSATAKEVATAGVQFVDVVGQPRFDLGTLTARLESRPGCVVTVIRKSDGPIAAKHGGIQYSLAVVKAAQQEVNLQHFLSEGFTSSPEAGIISNTTFLLHVSEDVWRSVLPSIRRRFDCCPHCGCKDAPVETCFSCGNPLSNCTQDGCTGATYSGCPECGGIWML
jgi:hypothetical protein